MRPPFSPNDPGLLTLSQFLQRRNPQGKYHSDDSYKTSLAEFWINQTLAPRGTSDLRWGQRWIVEGNDRGDLIYFRREHDIDRLVAVLHQGVLYVDALTDPRTVPSRVFYGKIPYDLHIQDIRPVKYPAEYTHLVTALATHNRARFPFVLQRLLLDGEPLEVRAEKQPRFDKGDSLVVLRADGHAVAMASDEWGATLILVVDEYQGRGIGQALAQRWYALNPSYTSGGFTAAGERNAIRTWATRVREFLANGEYSLLVREGVLTKSQVDAILADLPRRSGKKAKAAEATKAPPAVLVYLDDPKDPISFIVYDQRFLEDQADQYIYGFGFFRASENVGSFLFKLDYERAFDKIVTAIALQIAKDQNEPIYVGEGYGDVVEWQLIEGAIREGDYVHLTTDLLDLKHLARIERATRKPLDPYKEIEYSLVEQANSKWQ